MIYLTTREGVIFSVIFWLSALIALYFYLYWWRTGDTRHVSEEL